MNYHGNHSFYISDFTTSVSLSKYSELNSVVKMKKNTITKANNISFEETNTPLHKAIISPSTNDMLNDFFDKKFEYRNFVGKVIITKYEVVIVTENISDITLDGENILNNYLENITNNKPCTLMTELLSVSQRNMSLKYRKKTQLLRKLFIIMIPK